MNDNRTQKAKDQEWLRDVVRRSLDIHDNYHDNMNGIFAFQNGERKGLAINSDPAFEFEIAIRLFKHFQGVTEVSTTVLVKFLEDELNEA